VDNTTIEQWNVQVQFVVTCAYCYHTLTVSSDCTSPAQAIEECKAFGYTLEAKGPKCDKCHQYDTLEAEDE
jgi:hypothetical protein